MPIHTYQIYQNSSKLQLLSPVCWCNCLEHVSSISSDYIGCIQVVCCSYRSIQMKDRCCEMFNNYNRSVSPKKSTSTVCRSFKLGPPVKDIFTQVGGNEGTMIHDNTENYWLVVWNMNFIFPFHIWECHHPNWSELHHFSEA